jgi:hypothetical protein
MSTTIIDRIASNPNPYTWRGRFRRALSSLTWNRSAVIESGKIVFAIIGLGTILADFSTMKYWFIVPGVTLFAAVWFAIYIQMDGVQ